MAQVAQIDQTKRYRAWCFTVNNPTEQDEHRIYGLAETCTYVVAGAEIAPTTGTRHLQGFLYLPNGRVFSGVQNLLPAGAHIEVKSPYSTFAQATEYCKKDGDFFEHGEMPMDQNEKGECGKLSSEERWGLAKAGEFELLPPEHYTRYKAIYAEFRKVADRDELQNYWICGPSGCGKSRFVRDTYGPGTELGGDLGFYSKGMNKWWDGYNEEEIVLIDDFDPTHGVYLSYFLKIWADHYAFNAEVKQGFIKLRPKVIVVTSQYPISRCFAEPETIEAIERRFEVVQLAPFTQVAQYAPGFQHK